MLEVRELYISELEQLTNYYENLGVDRNYVVELYMHNLVDNIPMNEYSHSIYSKEQNIDVFGCYLDWDECGDSFAFNWLARTTQMLNSGFLVVDRVLAKQMANNIKQYAGNNNGRCLEIMAGLGSLSYALREQGVEVITTDLKVDNDCFKNYTNTWVDVEQIDCIEAIKKYGADVDFIICSWPRNSSPMVEVIDIMRKVNPDCILIYIGESTWGCNACDEFFEYANPVSGFEPIDVKKWSGIHDNCEFYN